MTWFRWSQEAKPKKSSIERESEEIWESLRNRKVPDPIAAMFLDEYLHSRRVEQKPKERFNDWGPYIEPPDWRRD